MDRTAEARKMLRCLDYLNNFPSVLIDIVWNFLPHPCADDIKNRKRKKYVYGVRRGGGDRNVFNHVSILSLDSDTIRSFMPTVGGTFVSLRFLASYYDHETRTFVTQLVTLGYESFTTTIVDKE